MNLMAPFSLTAWHTLVTFALFGLIWVVQLAIYPLFQRVGREGFVAYHAAYCARIAWVVTPLMMIEVLSIVGLMWLDPGPFAPRELGFNLAAIAGIWGATALWSVPAHRRLTRGFDPAAFQSLVKTNWIRTGLWTARALWLADALSS